MEPELKQRIIGTIVVTALAAIFIPMLFDEPVDNSGKAVSELSIPKPPVEADLASRIPENKEQVMAQGEPELSASESSEEDAVSGSGQINDIHNAVDGGAPPRQDFIPPNEADSEDKDKGGNTVSVDRVEEPGGDSQRPTLDTGDVDAVTTPDREAEAPVKTVQEKEPAATPEAKVTPAKTTGKAANKAKTESNKKPSSKLTRWSIQAGSFSKKENAQSLVDKLRKQGMPATIVSKGNLYRVKVGPELDKKKAAEMKAKLDRQNISSYLHSE